jgi:hypothetical protein
MSSARQTAIDRLKRHRDKFEKLMGLVENTAKQRLVGEKKQEARDRLVNIKVELKAEADELSRNHDGMSHFERCFLEPAMRQAYAELTIHAGTIPESTWHSNLSGALINIANVLHELNDLPDDWAPPGRT